MTEATRPAAAKPHRPALMAAPKTKNLAQKPPKGGMPSTDRASPVRATVSGMLVLARPAIWSMRVIGSPLRFMAIWHENRPIVSIMYRTKNISSGMMPATPAATASRA